MYKLCIILTVLAFTKPNLEVLVLTQNQGGIINLIQKDKSLESKLTNYFKILQEKVSLQNPDVIIYGIQELIELKPEVLIKKDLINFLTNMTGFADKDLDTVGENEAFKKMLEINLPNYTVYFNSNLSMSTFILIKNENGLVFGSFEKLKVVNKNGIFTTKEFNQGFWGQKGGIICLLEVSKGKDFFKIISVNTHLDSSSSERRKSQFLELLQETKNVVDQNGIENYSIFFAGDMNSRLGDEEIKILKENHEEKYHVVQEYMNYRNNDKNFYLKEEFSAYLRERNIFHMEEFKILFQPTYKLIFKTNLDCWLSENFDNCYKKKDTKKSFAYTDRIFYYSKNQILSCKDYVILETPMISDHFTVSGNFSIFIKNNELKKFISTSIPKNLEKFENLDNILVNEDEFDENNIDENPALKMKKYNISKILSKINNIKDVFNSNLIKEREEIPEEVVYNDFGSGKKLIII